MSVRSLTLAAAVGILTLAGCQSVHTQNAAPTLDQPVSLTLAPTPAPSPGATASPAASPSPSVAPKPAAGRVTYNSVTGVGKTVAITFDDGPSPKLTTELLDMLKARGVKATFYVVGQNAEAHPEILRRMVAEGHEVGNHSWNHPAFTKIGAAGVTSQVERTNAAIRAAIGENPKTLRPPYGATNAKISQRLHDEYGLKIIMWDVDPMDWKYRNAARVQNAILTQTKPGSIILVHDIHPSSVAAMPGTLDALLARGYKFVTVSELIAMEGSVAPAPSASPAASATVAPSPVASASPSASPFAVDRYEVPPAATPKP